MIEGFMNAVRGAAIQAGQGRVGTRHGTITSYDADNHSVKVKLQPDGTLTGWLPLKSAWIGNGWGLMLAPSIGDAIEVDFQEADGGVGSAGWRFFNDSERPLSVPASEAWLVHKSGSSIKLTTDGKLTLRDAGGTILQLNNGGAVAITGNVTVSGTIVAQGNVTGAGISLAGHHHSGVTAGSDNTGVPF